MHFYYQLILLAFLLIVKAIYLHHGMCPTILAQNGATALTMACANGHVEVVKALLVSEPMAIPPFLLENLKPNGPANNQKTAVEVIEALASFIFPFITPSHYDRLKLLLAKGKTEDVKVVVSRALHALKLEKDKRDEAAMKNSQQLLDDLAAEEAKEAKKKGKKKKKVAQQPANEVAREAAGEESNVDETR